MTVSTHTHTHKTSSNWLIKFPESTEQSTIDLNSKFDIYKMGKSAIQFRIIHISIEIKAFVWVVYIFRGADSLTFTPHSHIISLSFHSSRQLNDWFWCAKLIWPIKSLLKYTQHSIQSFAIHHINDIQLIHFRCWSTRLTQTQRDREWTMDLAC